MPEQLKKYLITGGAGFIGSSLTANLLASGMDVYSIDNFDPYYDPFLKRQNLLEFSDHPNFTFLEGDIRDQAFLVGCFNEFRPDIVIHLAAKGGVRPSLEQPVSYFETNVIGTINVLEAMKEVGVNKMIFASSSSVYGDAVPLPAVESAAAGYPVSPYGASKRSCELLCYTYAHLYGFHIHCLRFFTVFGPKQRPEMAISLFTQKILSGEPIQLFAEGKSFRDYTYIEDILNGIRLSVDQLDGFQVFNIGGGKSTQLVELVRMIEKATGRQAKIQLLPEQKGEAKRTLSDISKAKALLGYKPEISVPVGIQKYIQWFKKAGHLKH